jgi:hypothetical protein
VTRIELAFSAWEADVLPLNYTRVPDDDSPGEELDAAHCSGAADRGPESAVMDVVGGKAGSGLVEGRAEHEAGGYRWHCPDHDDGQQEHVRTVGRSGMALEPFAPYGRHHRTSERTSPACPRW